MEFNMLNKIHRDSCCHLFRPLLFEDFIIMIYHQIISHKVVKCHLSGII